MFSCSNSVQPVIYFFSGMMQPSVVPADLLRSWSDISVPSFCSFSSQPHIHECLQGGSLLPLSLPKHALPKDVSTAQLGALLQRFPFHSLLKGSRNRLSEGKRKAPGHCKGNGQMLSGEVRVGKGKARGLCGTAAEMLAGKWETQGTVAADQVCIRDLQS